MMSDTSGHMYEMPLAQYDRDSQCWRTSEATSLWALEMSSLTLPTWGGMRNGELFEQQKPEPLTTERDYSSLPTPTARDYKEQTLGWTWQRDGVTQEDTLPRALTAILPTPTAQAAKHLTMDDRGTGSKDDHNLWSVAGRLLPTPAVNDIRAGKDPQAWEEWAARQKAADGRPAPHGKSLEQEALKMLPTPIAMEHNYVGNPPHKRIGHQAGLIDVIEYLSEWIGATTHQPLSAGSTSSDAPHQPPLFNEQDEIA
jgi:hypothetical protein